MKKQRRLSLMCHHHTREEEQEVAFVPEAPLSG